MIKRIGLILACIALTCAAWAEPLQIKFEAFKVLVSAQGSESFTPADQAAPGDLIEYRASFTNSSAGPLHQLKPEIPVPAGMVLVLQSDKPAASEASLDGKNFSSLPLVDHAGQPIGADKIRSLRWLLPELKSGATRQFVCRATVAR